MTIGGGLTITDPTRHVDGTLDVDTAIACNTCHGSTTSIAPPKDTQGFTQTTATNEAPPKDTSGNTLTTFCGVGAHQAHVVGTGFAKAISCDECHKIPTDIASPGH